MDFKKLLALSTVAFSLLGCGTTRMSDTQRTATEQLLISNAVDQAVAEIDFSPLAGKSVFCDPQYLDSTVDKGYVISSVRQQLLANGCTLQEDRQRANYVVEIRSGGVGTDRNSVMVGIPEMTVPTILPGAPSHIPEVPFAKKSDQNGVAKLALFAYNRKTGKPYWQSGVVHAVSSARDTWLLGAGPFQKGSIRNGTEFAGHRLPLPPSNEDDDAKTSPAKVKLTDAVTWHEGKEPGLAEQLAELLGGSASDVDGVKEWFRAYLAAPAKTPKDPAAATKQDDKEKNSPPLEWADLSKLP